MAVTNTTLNWGYMSPEEQKKFQTNKAKADAIAPKPLKQKTGSPSNAFGSVKAYNTRANRSVYNKK